MVCAVEADCAMSMPCSIHMVFVAVNALQRAAKLRLSTHPQGEGAYAILDWSLVM